MSDNDFPVSRRRFLQGAGAAGTTLLAGCSFPELDDSDILPTDAPEEGMTDSLATYLRQVQDTTRRRRDRFDEAFQHLVDGASFLDAADAVEVDAGDTFFDGRYILHTHGLDASSLGNDVEVDPQIEFRPAGGGDRYLAMTDVRFPVKGLTYRRKDLGMGIRVCDQYRDQDLAAIQEFYDDVARAAIASYEREFRPANELQDTSLDAIRDEIEVRASRAGATEEALYQETRDQVEETKTYLEQRRDHYMSAVDFVEYIREESEINDGASAGGFWRCAFSDVDAPSLHYG